MQPVELGYGSNNSLLARLYTRGTKNSGGKCTSDILQGYPASFSFSEHIEAVVLR